MHIQVDQIETTFDNAIRDYRVGQDNPERMESVNNAVDFVQNTVCYVYITSKFELHN